MASIIVTLDDEQFDLIRKALSISRSQVGEDWREFEDLHNQLFIEELGWLRITNDDED